MTASRAKKRSARDIALCLLCLIFLILPAFAAEAQGRYEYIELGEDSKGVWSLYVPSVEERRYHSGSYLVGWVQVILKSDENDSPDELNIEELAQGDPEIAQALEFLADLGKMLSYNNDKHEPHREMLLYAANKDLKQIQRISAVYYDEEGGEISSNNGSFNPYLWKECPPGSMNEKIWRAIMKAAGR